MTQPEAAASCGLCLSDFRRLEAGCFRGARDVIAILAALARALSARLGRPVSAQWDLRGSRRPPDWLSGVRGRVALMLPRAAVPPTTPGAAPSVGALKGDDAAGDDPPE